MLKKYQQKYFWLNNNYTTAKNLSVKHFQAEIKVWHQTKVDLQTRYRELQNVPKINQQRKEKFLKQYKLSKLLKTLLKISEDFTYWQDERKKSTYLNIHMGSKLLSEMASRREVDKRLAKFLVPAEVESWFTKQHPSNKELVKRSAGCAVVVSRNGYYMPTGQAVKDLCQQMFAHNKKDNISDIRGLSASVGRAIGRVKIVKSVTEIKKVEQGDVLVAVMTRPDYISGMKKASAIVTNEGGITCHVAIVARELKIPCLIGTKIVTEVLKDGDLVEVNANHGWVRKVGG